MGGLFGKGQPTSPLAVGIRVNRALTAVPIPVVIGTSRVNGDCLWYAGFNAKQVSNGKGGKGGSYYQYSANLILSLCQGPIGGVANVWDTNGQFTSLGTSENYTVGSPYMYNPVNSNALQVDTGVSFPQTYNFTVADYGNPAGGVVLTGTTPSPLQYTPSPSPAAGEYTIDINNNYIFSPADAGKVATINYYYNIQYLDTQENFTVPATGPYTVRVSEYTYFIDDLGVTYFPSGIAFTEVFTTPTVAGTYEQAGGGTYLFSAADANQTITITYEYKDPTTQADAPTTLQYELFTGELSQAVWPFLESDYPGQALSYSQLAYTAWNPMILGSAAEVPNYNFEVQGFYIAGGGIPDANPVDAICGVLTDPGWGIGFPVNSLQSGQGIPINSSAGTPTVISGTVPPNPTSQNFFPGYFNYARAYFAANSFFISEVLDSQDTAASIISRWLEAGQCFACFSEGQMKLIPLGDTSAVANGYSYVTNTTPIVDVNDDVWTTDTKPKDPMTMTRTNYMDAYNRVQVDWQVRSAEYTSNILQEEDQASVSQFGPRIEEPQSWHFITTLPAAQFAANLRLLRYVYIRNTFQFELPSSYAFLEPGDLVTITDFYLGLQTFPVRILKIVDDPKKPLQITAEEFPWGTATATLYSKQASNPFAPNQGLEDPGATNVLIIEVPDRMSQFQSNELAIFCNGGNSWGGCQICLSVDGANYQTLDTVQRPATTGTLTADLPPFGGTNPDTTDTLTVQLNNSYQELPSFSTTGAQTVGALCALIENTTGNPTPVVPTVVQSTAPTAITSSGSVVSFASAVTPGNTIIVGLFSADGSAINVTNLTDDQFDPYSRVFGNVATVGLSTWYAPNCGAAQNVTVTASSITTVYVQLIEVSGISQSNPVLDTNNGDENNFVATALSGTATFAASDFAIAFCCSNQNATDADAGWTHIYDGTLYDSKWANLTIPGSLQATWTLAASGSYAAQILGFKVQSAATLSLELLGYKTATLSGLNTYTLDTLYRGQFNTSPSQDHPIGTLFAFLSDASYTYVYDSSLYGKTVYMKFPSYNTYNKRQQSLADVTAYQFTLQGTGPGAIDAATGIYRPGIGAIPNSWVGTFSYTATTTSITWNWNITVYNSQMPLPGNDDIQSLAYNGSLTISSLSAGVQYAFYPFVDSTGQFGGGIQWVNSSEVSGGLGSPAIAYTTTPATAAVFASRNDRVPISDAPMYATTPASGTGSGSGGGSGGVCPRADMMVKKDTGEVVRIDTVQVGDWIMENAVTSVEVIAVKHESARNWIIVETDNGESCVMTEVHTWPVWTGEEIIDVPTNQLTMDSMLIKEDGTPTQIVSMRRYQQSDTAVKLTVDSPDHRYLVGKKEPKLLTHNVRVVTS